MSITQYSDRFLTKAVAGETAYVEDSHGHSARIREAKIVTASRTGAVVIFNAGTQYERTAAYKLRNGRYVSAEQYDDSVLLTQEAAAEVTASNNRREAVDTLRTSAAYVGDELRQNSRYLEPKDLREAAQKLLDLAAKLDEQFK